jgi:hypothetical protein
MSARTRRASTTIPMISGGACMIITSFNFEPNWRAARGPYKEIAMFPKFEQGFPVAMKAAHASWSVF